MRSFLRLTLLNAVSLAGVSSFYAGLIVSTKIIDILKAAAIFTLINYLVKPLVKLVLLPINLVTLGIFGWLANVIILFFLTKIVSTVKVTAFTFQTVNYQGFTIPSLNLSFTTSLILASLFLSFIFNLINWLLTK